MGRYGISAGVKPEASGTLCIQWKKMASAYRGALPLRDSSIWGFKRAVGRLQHLLLIFF